MSTQLVMPPSVVEYLALQERLEALKLQKDLAAFVREAWPIIEADAPYEHGWHHDCICEYLQAVRLGQIRFLIVNIPPRTLKSTFVSIDFPCWWWTSEPSERFMFVSYGDSLVKDHSEKRRTIIESDWYQRRWGAAAPAPDDAKNDKRVVLASDQNEKREFLNTLRGRMVATTINGQLTGKGGNVAIIDDPIDPEAADSDAGRLDAEKFIDRTLMSRFDDKRTARLVLVMQRLATNDTTAHEEAKGYYTKLILPAEFKRKTVIEFPVTKKQIVKNEGELLDEKRHPQDVLNMLKVGMTQQQFEAQYNQEPRELQGKLLKREWWRYYGGVTGVQLPEEFDIVVDSWDMTFKKESASKAKAKTQPDFVVGGKWGCKGADVFLLQLTHRRMSFTEAQDAVLTMSTTEPFPSSVLIEDTANGPAVIDSLKQHISGIHAIQVNKDKVERANAASPLLRAGNVYLPHPSILDEQSAAVLNECVDEASAFPSAGVPDDFVDMWSQFTTWFVKHGGGMLAWVQMRARQLSDRAAEQTRRAKEGRVEITTTEKQPNKKNGKDENAMTFADLMM